MFFKFNLVCALLLRKNNKNTENPVNCFLHDDASGGTRTVVSKYVLFYSYWSFKVYMKLNFRL